jgi:hypothetical protein
MPEQPVETAANHTNETAACDVCGRPGAVEMGDRVVCADCYAGCGSCCSDIDVKETEG